MTYQNAYNLKGGTDSVMVNELNLTSGVIYKNIHLLRNVKCWHKFIVNNTDGLSRDQVLKPILDHVHPLDLIPVFFAKDPISPNSYFLARNCEAAIEKLCKDNLVVDHPLNKGNNSRHFKPFKLSIILNFSNTNDIKIDVQKNVSTVLAKRFNLNTKTLDLDNFSEDPELTEFCPLAQPKIMFFVLHIAKTLNPEEIILSNNSIKILNPLDVLIGVKIRAVDLSNNQLASLTDLSPLKHFQLKELKLSGNNLCGCEEDVYVSQVKLLCPTIEILDGVTLNLDKFPVTRKNFLCNYDSFNLVNQFLEYFFTVYDSKDRKALAGLYHKDAMFSLTCVYLAGQFSSSTAFLRTYSNVSRNLKKAADISKAHEYLFRGKDSIMDVFTNKLPLTEHDPYSFNADLMYKTDKCAVIVVSGVFYEAPTSLLDKKRFLGFTRTFSLEIYNNLKCVITNEQLHVYNGLTCQQKKSFTPAAPPIKVVEKELIPKPQSESDYLDLITTFGHITNLKEMWARKCLEECDFNLKKSLQLFVDLLKADKFPAVAFVQNNSSTEVKQNTPHVPSRGDPVVVSNVCNATDFDNNNVVPMPVHSLSTLEPNQVLPKLPDSSKKRIKEKHRCLHFLL